MPRSPRRTQRHTSGPLAERKWEIRESVWQRLEAERLAAFPRPVYGRIPNFVDAGRAAARLAELPEFRDARVVKVNPDAPQRPVRRLVLEHGKLLLMPTPRLREGFILLDPAQLPASRHHEAASITGAFQLGRQIGLDELPEIDLIVVGSAAVSPAGGRLGKGEGYAELEYAVLRALGLIDPDLPIATTVHDVQLVPEVPVEPFDVPVDLIVTPTQVLRVPERPPRPAGVLWEHLTPDRLEAMPILQELRARGPQES